LNHFGNHQLSQLHYLSSSNHQNAYTVPIALRGKSVALRKSARSSLGGFAPMGKLESKNIMVEKGGHLERHRMLVLPSKRG
jgi:hypothetical protein